MSAFAQAYRSPDEDRPHNKLLASLPSDEYERVAPHLKPAPLAFRDVLQKQGETIRNLYFPGGGVCSVMRILQDGGTAEIAAIGHEGVVGLFGVDGRSESPGDCVVQVPDSEALVLSYADFVALTEQSEPFADLVQRYNQTFIAQVMQIVACNALHSVEQRCCRWLSNTRDRVSRETFPMTQEFLSALLGVRRPTVTIVLGSLETRGLIDYQRGRVTIRDRSALEAASCECYRVLRMLYHRILPEVAV